MRSSACACGDAERDVERAVAVERRHLDRHDIVDGGKARPEGARQRNAADRRLQVEADQRHLPRDRGAMLDQLVLAGALQRGQRQQHGVIAQRARGPRLLDRLRRLADGAGDHHQRPVGPFARRLDRKLQHRPVEPDLADRELRRMHADGQAARPRIDVVAADRALRLLVELAIGTERQRMRRDHRAAGAAGERTGGGSSFQCSWRVMSYPNPVPGRRGQRRGSDRPGRWRAAAGSSACSRAALTAPCRLQPAPDFGDAHRARR